MGEVKDSRTISHRQPVMTPGIWAKLATVIARRPFRRRKISRLFSTFVETRGIMRTKRKMRMSPRFTKEFISMPPL